MAKSLADRRAEKVFQRQYSKKLPEDIQKRARDKLLTVDNAGDVRDLHHPPGNRLKKLSGRREGRWSTRINQQWRVCFEWRNSHAYLVEIVDYH